MKKTRSIAMALVLLTMLVSLGCSGKVHYEDERFGFAIDYPKGWVLERLNPNEIGLAPQNSQLNQIQIASYFGDVYMASTADYLVSRAVESTIREWLELVDARSVRLTLNRRNYSGDWDWLARFTFTVAGRQGSGAMYFREEGLNSYTISCIHYDAWQEGYDVIDSFRVVR